MELERFSYEADGAPKLSAPGIAIAALPVEASGDALRIPLRLTWRLAEPESRQFASVPAAIVVQAASDAYAFAVPLRDPDRGEEPYVANFQRAEKPSGHPDNSYAGWVSCTLKLPPAQRVFLHATLLGRTSNAVEIKGVSDAVRNADPSSR